MGGRNAGEYAQGTRSGDGPPETSSEAHGSAVVLVVEFEVADESVHVQLRSAHVGVAHLDVGGVDLSLAPWVGKESSHAYI